MSRAFRHLYADEAAALRAVRQAVGTQWKRYLLSAWQRADTIFSEQHHAALLRVRDRIGPSGLVTITTKELDQ